MTVSLLLENNHSSKKNQTGSPTEMTRTILKFKMNSTLKIQLLWIMDSASPQETGPIMLGPPTNIRDHLEISSNLTHKLPIRPMLNPRLRLRQRQRRNQTGSPTLMLKMIKNARVN